MIEKYSGIDFKIDDIDELYFAVARITTHVIEDTKVRNTPCSSATGFFYMNTKGKLFIVTNRHVVIDETKKYYPDILRLYLHTDSNDLTKTRSFDIKLYDKLSRRWNEPNTTNTDLIALPILEEFNEDDTHLSSFSEEHILPSGEKLSAGQDVLIMGYPLGMWYDAKNNLPVIRSGIVSSAYPVSYNGNPYFLVDSRLHPGTSGAPVITKPPNRLIKRESVSKATRKKGFIITRDIYDKWRNHRFLLGINARTFPFPPEEQPLDLNAVYFSWLIKEITN